MGAVIGLKRRRRIIPINGNFETDLSGGWAGTNSAALTRVTTQAQYGVASMQVVTPGAVVDEGPLRLSFAVMAGEPYTGSVWVKAPLGALLTAGLQGRTAADVFSNFTQQQFTGTGDWQRVVVTHTMGALEVLSRINVYTRSVAQAITFWVDGVQIEQGTVASPYRVAA